MKVNGACEYRWVVVIDLNWMTLLFLRMEVAKVPTPYAELGDPKKQKDPRQRDREPYNGDDHERLRQIPFHLILGTGSAQL